MTTTKPKPTFLANKPAKANTTADAEHLASTFHPVGMAGEQTEVPTDVVTEEPQVAQASIETLDDIMKAARTVTAQMQSSRPAGLASPRAAKGPAPDGYYSHLVTYVRPGGGKPVLAQRVRGRSYWPFSVSAPILAELEKAVEAGTVYVKGTPPQE